MANIVYTNIPNALTSVAADHIVANALDVYDELLQDYQEGINQTLTDNIAKVEQNVYGIHGSASLSTTVSTFEKGVSTSVTATGVFSFNSTNKTADFSLTSSSGSSKSASSASSVSLTESITDTTTYTLSAVLNGDTDYSVTKTATKTVTAYLPCFVGISAVNYASLTSANILAFANKLIKSSASGTYTMTATEGSYLYIALPSGSTAPSVTSSGFSVPMTSCGTRTVSVNAGDTAYDIYQSGQLSAGSLTVTIS